MTDRLKRVASNTLWTPHADFVMWLNRVAKFRASELEQFT